MGLLSFLMKKWLLESVLRAIHEDLEHIYYGASLSQNVI